MHFHLDTRRPEPRPAGQGRGTASGKRQTLSDLLTDRLRDRVLPPSIARESLIALGMHYLQQAEDAVAASLPVLDG
jgi:hypothetical protein